MKEINVVGYSTINHNTLERPSALLEDPISLVFLAEEVYARVQKARERQIKSTQRHGLSLSTLEPALSRPGRLCNL